MTHKTAGPIKYRRTWYKKIFDGITHFWRGFFFDPIMHCRFLLLRITRSHTDTSIPPMQIMTLPEVIAAIRAGRSLIRFGDGEVALTLGRSIKFQKANWRLKSLLQALVRTYTNTSPYILCIPVQALKAEKVSHQEAMYRSIWTLFRLFYTHRFNHHARYADAHLFYTPEHLLAITQPHFKDRTVLCVGKADIQSPTLQRFFTEHFAAWHFIVAPATDAFSEEATIIARIEASIKTLAPTETPLLMLGIGPTSKTIAYHFAERSIQALDIGHGLELLASGTDFRDKLAVYQ
jgi:hypothetical protein